MKKMFVLILAFVASLSFGFAQEKTLSPAAEAKGKIGEATVKIKYSQPSARGRKIMGGLVPYGEVWRTGANNATTIEFDKPVKIEGKDVAAGKYALFTIPNENEWIVILNKDHGQWGAYKYKDKDDVIRVNVKPSKTTDFVEAFTISVEKDQVVMKWENTAAAFKVKG